MIQDIYPHKLRNQYDPARKPQDDSYVMAFRKQEVLLCEDPHTVGFPRVCDFSMREDQKEALQYLFTIDETDCYMLAADAFEPEKEAGTGSLAMPAGFAFRDAGQLRRMDIGPRENLFAEFTGHQLYR